MQLASYDCPVCHLENLPQNESSGARLVCNHWLCWMCFAKLMRSENSTSIRCPLCRKVDGSIDAEAEETDDEFNDDELQTDSGDMATVRQFNVRIKNISFANCRVFICSD